MPIEDAKQFGDRGEPVEKQRVCPSCRMLISILATKCRYCGEEVGKPKDETRELTAQDLGGETIYHRAPSGSVMDALESFRVEETSARQRLETPPPGPKKSLIKRGKAQFETEPVESRGGDLPELDQASRDLADAVLAPATKSHFSTVSKRYERTPGEKAFLIGAWVVGAIILIFAAIKGLDYYQDYRARQAEANRVVVVNRAPALIEQGAAPIEILEAAAQAYEEEPSSNNRRIAEDALGRVISQFNNLLNPEQLSPPEAWSMQKISAASDLAERAASLYPNESTRRLKQEADREMGFYRMVLSGGTDGAAQFKISYPSPKTISVKVGDTLEDRFIVKSVSGQEARLQDVLRRDRIGRPREITFRRDGSMPY